MGKTSVRERTERETDGVEVSFDIDPAQLGKLFDELLLRGNVLEQLVHDRAGHVHDGQAGVRGDGRDELERPSPSRGSTRRRAHDRLRPRLDHDPAEQRRERPRVVVRHVPQSADFPGVQGRIREAVRRRDEGEDAGIASHGFAFEH